MRKLLKKHGFAPEVLVTDRLRSYGAARSELGPAALHEQGLRRNNRRRERKLQRFKSPESAQRFLSTHASVYVPSTASPITPSFRSVRGRSSAKLTSLVSL